jgi:hypothetical protein
MARGYKVKLLDDVLDYFETGRRYRADAMLSIRETELFFNQVLVGAQMAFCAMLDARDENQRAIRDALYERFVYHLENVSRPFDFKPVAVTDEEDETSL